MSLFLEVGRLEGIRQEFPCGLAYRVPVRVGENDRRIGFGKLGNLLPATPAGRNRTSCPRHDANLLDFRFARRHHGRDRPGLRASPLRVSRILDVAPDERLA